MHQTFGNLGAGGHLIIHSDVVDGLAQLKTASVDLVFADPPYNIGKNFEGFYDSVNPEVYFSWCFEWIDHCLRVLKPNGTFYLMSATQNMPILDMYCSKKLTVLSRIIWSYDSSGVQAKSFFGSMYEPILHMVKNKRKYTFNSADIRVEAKTGALRKLIDYRKNPPRPYNATKVPGNVWTFPRVRYKMAEYENHPTQKPERLLDRIIRASSNIGDIVLDPFSGSFTTGRVAQKLKRKSINIERNETYVKIGLRRLRISPASACKASSTGISER